MNIREMIETDYDQVYQLWLSCAGMGLNDLDDSKEGIARFLQRNPQTCLVAVENQTIIGAILVGSDGRRAYIYPIQLFIRITVGEGLLGSWLRQF